MPKEKSPEEVRAERAEESRILKELEQRRIDKEHADRELAAAERNAETALVVKRNRDVLREIIEGMKDLAERVKENPGNRELAAAYEDLKQRIAAL